MTVGERDDSWVIEDISFTQPDPFQYNIEHRYIQYHSVRVGDVFHIPGRGRGKVGWILKLKGIESIHVGMVFERPIHNGHNLAGLLNKFDTNGWWYALSDLLDRTPVDFELEVPPIQEIQNAFDSMF